MGNTPSSRGNQLRKAPCREKAPCRGVDLPRHVKSNTRQRRQKLFKSFVGTEFRYFKAVAKGQSDYQTADCGGKPGTSRWSVSNSVKVFPEYTSSHARARCCHDGVPTRHVLYRLALPTPISLSHSTLVFAGRQNRNVRERNQAATAGSFGVAGVDF
jgi:hypothetical protein